MQRTEGRSQYLLQRFREWEMEVRAGIEFERICGRDPASRTGKGQVSAFGWHAFQQAPVGWFNISMQAVV
jgi:hypothetical protein